MLLKHINYVLYKHISDLVDIAMVEDESVSMDDMAVYRALGAAIVRRRKALNLTQADLAERAYLSRSALANLETGRTRVLLHQVYLLADALGLGMSDLLPDEKAEPIRATLPRIDPAIVTPSQRRQIEGAIHRALSVGGRVETSPA